jgi:hypothetical protein
MDEWNIEFVFAFWMLCISLCFYVIFGVRPAAIMP